MHITKNEREEGWNVVWRWDERCPPFRTRVVQSAKPSDKVTRTCGPKVRIRIHQILLRIPALKRGDDDEGLNFPFL
jgi:hypothetical protein